MCRCAASSVYANVMRLIIRVIISTLPIFTAIECTTFVFELHICFAGIVISTKNKLGNKQVHHRSETSDRLQKVSFASFDLNATHETHAHRGKWWDEKGREGESEGKGESQRGKRNLFKRQIEIVFDKMCMYASWGVAHSISMSFGFCIWLTTNENNHLHNGTLVSDNDEVMCRFINIRCCTK